ncbi:hypothetical protein EJB05_23326, partial [Eragrostis curvula]
MALLVVSAMHAVPAQAGRALGQIGYGSLDPAGKTPSSAGHTPGGAYTRPCVYKYGCAPPHVP